MYYKISIKPLNLYGKGGIVMKKTNLKCTDTASTESSLSEADIHNSLKPKTKTASARVLLFCFLHFIRLLPFCVRPPTPQKNTVQNARYLLVEGSAPLRAPPLPTGGFLTASKTSLTRCSECFASFGIGMPQVPTNPNQCKTPPQ